MAITKITTPELFDFSATNTALQLPTGDTASRPSAPSTGEWRFNSELKYVEYYDGAAWFKIDTEATANPADFPSQNFNVSTYFGTDASNKIDAKFNEAANFNGASSNGSEISIADANVFSPVNNNLSFSCWIKTTVNNTYIASKLDDASGGGGYEWGFFTNTNGTIQILCHSSGGSGTAATVASSQTTALDGNWNQVGFVIDYGNSVTVYVNGVGTTSTSWSGIMTNTSVPVLLGAATNIPAARMLGSIDQVRIFNTALTDAQAEDLYTDETATTAATLDFPVGAGCIAAYQLDGDASDVGGTYGGVTTNIGYTGLKFQPDFVWIKRRVSGSESHALYDSARGINEQLSSDTDAAETTNTAPFEGFTSFDANGFTVDNNGATNRAPNSYVAWAFKGGGAPDATNSNGAGVAPTLGSVMIDGVKSTAALAGTTAATKISANTKAGFSIVQFSGNLSSSGNIQVGHGLSSPPELIIQKNTQDTGTWWARPFFLNNNPYQYLGLSESASLVTSSSSDGTMAVPTSTTFDNNWNTSLGSSTGVPVIAYCFHSVAGYQKIGSYTGDGNTSGNYIYTTSDGTATGTDGFEPAFLLLKNTDTPGTSWLLYDNKRTPTNPIETALIANSSSADVTTSVFKINFFTNGFEVTGNGSDINGSGDTFIYLAIAADKDTSVPTQANSFSPTLYTGNGGTQSITLTNGMKPDFVWVKDRDNNGTSHTLADSVRGVNNTINSNTTNGQYNNTTYQYNSFNNDGFTVTDDNGGNYGVNGDGIDYISWNWKAGGLPTINSDGDIPSIVSANQAAGFSIVSFTCPSSNQNFNIGHGLGVKPDMVIMKKTNATGAWLTWHKDLSVESYYLQLNSNLGESGLTQDSRIWGDQSFTSTTISTSTGYSFDVNDTVVSYCFADIAGYQRVSSYPGSGVAGKRVYVTNDGLATGSGGFQPSYVLIKCSTASSTDWLIFTSNVVDGSGDPVMLRANTNESQFTGDRVQFTSDGFTIEDVDGSRNGSGRTYIYLAIA